MANGVHSRALYASEEIAVIGGVGGEVAVQFIDQEKEGSNQIKIEGTEDFRDVHCNNDGVCIFLNSGSTAIITGIPPNGIPLEVYRKDSVFLDGMDFWNKEQGIAYGDPVDGHFFLIKTKDTGLNWEELSPTTLPVALKKEAGFAASGSGIQTIGDSTVYFATGLGETARLFCSYDQGENWLAKNTPMRSGDASYGIYSIYFWSQN